MSGELRRCEWCEGHELYRTYHDEEWGVPERDDARLFEKLILDGAQAGLSWLTILKKRDNYRRAFDGFDAEKIASYGPAKIEALLSDPGIVRNRLKVHAAVTNARAYLKLREELGSFARYLWQFVEGEMTVNHRGSLREVPAQTPASDAMSRDLQLRGFKFVGSTICYAFMQATGMVNDHLIDCFRWAPCTELGGADHRRNSPTSARRR